MYVVSWIHVVKGACMFTNEAKATIDGAVQAAHGDRQVKDAGGFMEIELKPNPYNYWPTTNPGGRLAGIGLLNTIRDKHAAKSTSPGVV